MGERKAMSQDYIALEWVKGEIKETLQQAQQALELYVEQPQDKSRLNFCLSYLHQVHGTLQMVEFYGAALLAEEMEAVASDLASGSLSHEQDGLEVLMQAIIQLPHYLEHVKVGRRDLPVVLLPILNELRSTRGENFLSETSLFTPVIAHNPTLSAEQLAAFEAGNFSQWLRKTRQMMQAATLQLLQNREPDLARHYLNKLFARLNKALGGTPQGVIWLPALAFSEWLMRQDNLPKSAKVLLRQLDQVLKQAVDEGAPALNRPPADDLLKNLLFYVARTDTRGDAIRLVQKRFELHDSLPTEDELQHERDAFSGPGSDAIGSALTALIDEINAIKERLDLLVRGSQERVPVLNDVRVSIKQIADTMGMLGLGMPRKVMQEQEQAVVALLENGDASDDALLDVAGALLYVEATLSGMQRAGDLNSTPSDSAMSDAQKAVLREARNVIEQIKDAIVSFIAHQWSPAELSVVPSLLHSTEGSINMIPLPRIAAVLAELATFVEQALLVDSPKQDWQLMDLLAEVLSGTEYYLERYADVAEGTDDELLTRVENTLGHLMLSADLVRDGDSTEDAGSELLNDVFTGSNGADESIEVTSFNDALDAEGDAENDNDAFSSDADNDEENIELEALAPVLDLPEIIDVEGSDESVPLLNTEDALAENREDDDDLIDEEIIEVFLEEAEEVIETLNDSWPAFRAHNDDQEALSTVRRAFHTLKGSGRMVRAMDIGELSWSIENMFNRVLDDTIEISTPLLALVDHVITLLPGLVEDFRLQQAPSIDPLPLMDYAFAIAKGEAVGELPITGVNATADTAEEIEDDEFEELELEVQVRELDEDDLALIDIFIGEAEVHLATVNAFIRDSWDNDFLNPISDDLQRALHTLKGSAHMAGLTAFADIASPMERLVKELRAYQAKNCTALIDVLEQGEAVLRSVLTPEQLATLTSIDGSKKLQKHLRKLEQTLLKPLQDEQNPQAPNPEAIARFLSGGMDSLLEAEDLLQRWQITADASILSAMIDDLGSVAQGAQEAELPMVQALTEGLEEFYINIREQDVPPSEELIDFATNAHEELLGMMDCLAAGQDIPAATETLSRLHEWPLNVITTPSFVPSNNFEFDESDAETESDAVIEALPVDDAIDSLEDEIAAVESESAEVEWLPEVTSSEEQIDREEEEDDLILDIFLEEADEISETIESVLQNWQQSPDNLLPVAQLQRELHTMKGGARMAELPEIAALCHELETLYERLNDGVLERDEATFPLLQRAHDTLAEQLQAVRRGDLPDDAAALIAEIHSYLTVPTPEASAEYVPQSMAKDAVHSESADDADREILEIFLEEAGELQEALDRALHHWEQEPDSRAGADEAQRVLHTLKGGARLSGLKDIGDLAHDFESDIQKALDRNARCDDAFFKHAYQRHDAIVVRIEALAALLNGEGVLAHDSGDRLIEVADEIPVAEVDDASDDMVDTPTVAGDVETSEQSLVPLVESKPSNVLPLRREQPKAPAQAVASPASSQRKAPTELVKVSADLLDNLVNLAGETAIGRGRLEQQVSDFSHTLGDMDMTLERLRDQLRRLDQETEAQVLFRQERQGPNYDDFDPLEMDRYSSMQQLSRALMESASDLIDLKDTLTHKTRDAETLLLQQSRVNTELQEGLMKTRMVPFQRLVPRLRRIVRQVSLELNKQVDLRVYNAEGEMDRTILERMISPLEHMVRNAVDHGIEHTEQRLQSGKDAQGSIELDIRRDGGDVVLTMRDDGKGINLEAVRRKAIERGMTTPDARLTEEEVMQFILQPGFSTAEVVTQISGRGVGMDVVSSEIKQMGGSVEIRSNPGVGTEFEVRLPFTVSVNRALMVRVGDDLYAVPLNNIQGIVRASVAELQSLYEQPVSERRFEYAGNDYRLDYLGAMLDVEAQPKVTAQHLPLPLLLIRGSVPFALQVDSLLGSREIVVKSLGPQFASVMGISGGTILGDGSVVIILDLPAMIRTQSSLEYQRAKALDMQEAERRHEQERRLPRVLVVDDSVTVRKVTTRLLERHGMEVFTAKDGVHAMETLQDHRPDVMLLDIEMPRMDGFEVASLVRHDARLKDIPIIMITSRTGDKHRERAMSIGVNEYLGKPFQEDRLLECINSFLGNEDA
ncbi:MAG: Hpt domain-containing protein [Thalassolituus oleivorans]|uniref:Hpt domain-containing protein n=1 Tax=Thalassolituus oleivorans TaxID=187493 RepID=UPI001B754A06|nr:Hpt domain-containing protein [Thalassolituus oleivorans]MBQ0728294.1 Hpt domain-containing protein [Thalassolituus oleivorans]MBQ0780067.1 Hpt domain-containing protein [Thalassolituus oleivorans]